MSEAKQKHYPKHTGDNGGAPAGTPAKQRPSSLAEGAWATTEHPHAPTNKSPFAESEWSFADQLLNLRGGMVSSIRDISKLLRFRQTAEQRFKRHNDRITGNDTDIQLVNIDVDSIKRWRERATKDINDIVGATQVSPIGTKNLTELTANMAEQHALNAKVQEKLDALDVFFFWARLLGGVAFLGVVALVVVATAGYQF